MDTLFLEDSYLLFEYFFQQTLIIMWCKLILEDKKNGFLGYDIRLHLVVRF